MCWSDLEWYKKLGIIILIVIVLYLVISFIIGTGFLNNINIGNTPIDYNSGIPLNKTKI